MKHELSEKWIKAAIAGTIWAASEIVLGSFLHNLRIPFSGNFLTAIGIVILISISFIWTDRGLFWRAGLICAIMKTMSPSAVIFGPMVAITAEAFLIELFTRILGRTYAGYIAGAMLAMSWNLFHKIISYIINYGSDIVEVYTRLLNMAQKQLNIETDIVWLPIIILLVVYSLFGVFAGVIGIMVGKKMLDQPPAIVLKDLSTAKTPAFSATKKKFDYSIAWLLADLLLIIGSFTLLNKTPWFVWCATVTGNIILWAFRYKSSLRRISKPKFWIFFVLITLLTAFVFSGTPDGETDFLNGLLTGVQMNFRAALIIVGFSVLGTELYNPKIRDSFSKTAFKHLPLALELSVESLPDFIASIPDFKTLVRNPVSVLFNVISHAGAKLSEIRENKRSGKRLFIATGGKKAGKTTFAKRIAGELKLKGFPVGGILAERVMEDSETTGYDLVDIETGRREIFLRQDEKRWTGKIGKFKINPQGLEFGISILGPENQTGNKLIIIDEVGMLELNKMGWYSSLQKLIMASTGHILFTVRDIHVDAVAQMLGNPEITIFKVSEDDPYKAAITLLSLQQYDETN
ncbi:MAG: nucleoside-triphosphatase [Bacteroidota bacterium]